MANKILVNKPAYRKLRGYAFDPSTSLNLDTAVINQLTYKVAWEDDLKPGPEGDYIKVIDRDPPSDAVYKPVDLNDPNILASDGLEPSETNPQFHQQMVYAVIMTTIKNFEKAMGRKVMWKPTAIYDKDNKRKFQLEKLLVFPHAFRDQNAYYSPERKALLFGYYNATPVSSGIFLPGGIVYSCLSHDIIAHETTHAILDGVYSHYMDNTHPDIAGFHEGFSDLVALLQHFMYPDILRDQIRQAKGKLETENLLVKLAVEFGQSTGQFHSLRDAIGSDDDNGNWTQKKPKSTDYENSLECHDRGALLVSAVFDAFLAIYKNRTADIVRLATGGTGIVPEGEIHPDFVARLADEAAKVASHVMNMCVRALDYCPPVDMNYGDYLRALITADKELVANDDHNYRIAFINAFRKRGIFPEGVPNLSVDTLCYNSSENETDKTGVTKKIAEFLRGFKGRLAYQTDRSKIFEETQAFISGDKEKGIDGLHSYIFGAKGVVSNATQFEKLTGLVFSAGYKEFGIGSSRTYGHGFPSVEIHSLRINNRIGPDGTAQNQITLSLMQRCKVAVTEDENGKKIFKRFRPKNATDESGECLTFRGGCTLIFDLDDLTLRHAIRKPIFDMKHQGGGKNRKLRYNDKRLQMQYRCEYGDLYTKIGFASAVQDKSEPFASLHQAKTPLL